MRSWFHKIAYRLFDNGYFTVGKWSGIPMRFHWTAVIGALFFGRFQWAPALWFGFFFIIAIHEMGHAVVVLDAVQCQYRSTFMALGDFAVGEAP